jgi:hypothetical protein
MSIYREWGFISNPFSTTPLAADDLGEKLLVGRDSELMALVSQLENPPRHPTVEGLNGIGKTSLINVACYRLYSRFMRSGNGPLFVPCRRRFQLQEATDTAQLLHDIFYEIGHSILKFKESLWAKGERLPHLQAIKRWLELPAVSSFSANISAAGIGGLGFGGSSGSSQKGFNDSGFRRLMVEWLGELFEEGDEGGIIVLIDNIELCGTTDRAKSHLEILRDDLLSVPGIRCVFSGAPGMFLGPLSSPRLSGFFHDPIEVEGIAPASSGKILKSRVEAYSGITGEAYLPISEQSFEDLYVVLNRNLRALLEYADKYCMFVEEGGDHPQTAAAQRNLFYSWLRGEGQKVFDACDQQLTGRCWEVFDVAVKMGGAFSPSDYQRFQCNSQEALRPYVKTLEDYELVVSVRDDTDKRRKTMLVTPKGHLVAYYRTTRSSIS